MKVVLTSFAVKCLSFAQIQENFAQSCDFTTLAFRSSGSSEHYVDSGGVSKVLKQVFQFSFHESHILNIHQGMLRVKLS